MKKKTYPKNHHYVPQFLLKNFCFGKKKKVWVYDKKTDKEFETNIRNIASETKFYELKGKDLIKSADKEWKKLVSEAPESIREALDKGEFNVSLEEGFNTLEGNSRNIIKRIIKNESLTGLTKEEKIVLALFLSVQLVRTKTYIDKIKCVNDMLVEKLTGMGFTNEQAEESVPVNDKDLKFLHMKQIVDAEKFVPHFLNKIWVLYKAPPGSSFYIGDNPIVLQNQNKSKFYGNLGLAVKGIEIYFPIAKNYAIALFCPSIGDMFDDVEQKIQMYPEYLPKEKTEYSLRMIRSIKAGLVVELLSTSVENLNYLQVVFSSRFVFGHKKEFSLVKEMIKDDDVYRGFLKPHVG